MSSSWDPRIFEEKRGLSFYGSFALPPPNPKLPSAGPPHPAPRWKPPWPSPACLAPQARTSCGQPRLLLSPIPTCHPLTQPPLPALQSWGTQAKHLLTASPPSSHPPPAKSPRCFSPRPAPCPLRVVTTSKAGQTSPVQAPRGSPLKSRRQREDGAMPSPSLQKLPQLTPGCADCLLRPRQSHIPAALPQPTRPSLRTIL